MCSTQQTEGYIPQLHLSSLIQCGVQHLELGRPCLSNEVLMDVVAIDGRADANAFQRTPDLKRMFRAATVREQAAYGLPNQAIAVVTRDEDGCITTEYFA